MLLAPSSARELAMARVVVALVWLLSEDVHRAAEGAAIPAALRVFPLGTAWASSLVTPGAASVACVVVLVAAALALVGWQTRSALATLALFGTYLLGVGQLRGAVLHDHHLVWLAALLAASPAGDALSVDAWLAARAGRPPLASRPSARYGAPLRFAWLLIACVYFFPGLHKLSVSGLGWIFSDNLRNQLWLKWAETEGAFVPLARIDRFPTVLRIGALGVVLLELGFGPMVLANRTTRAIAVALAFLFHQATAAFLAIRYETLWVCLAIFLPWDPASCGTPARPPATRRSPPRARRWSWAPPSSSPCPSRGSRGRTRRGLSRPIPPSSTWPRIGCRTWGSRWWTLEARCTSLPASW